MTKFTVRVFIIALISLTFMGVAALAAESASDKPTTVDLKALETVQQFKDDLPSNAEELHLKGFQDLQKQGPVIVLDVRSKESFAKRHLKDSVNAPLTDLTEKNLPTLVPDKNTPVVLACDYSFMPIRQLAMTLQAYPVLKHNGYTKIYRLNLWRDPDNNKMIESYEQEKVLAFEGTDVKPEPTNKK
jgi:rhodanese-related sulfurtransferase